MYNIINIIKSICIVVNAIFLCILLISCSKSVSGEPDGIKNSSIEDIESQTIEEFTSEFVGAYSDEETDLLKFVSIEAITEIALQCMFDSVSENNSECDSIEDDKSKRILIERMLISINEMLRGEYSEVDEWSIRNIDCSIAIERSCSNMNASKANNIVLENSMNNCMILRIIGIEKHISKKKTENTHYSSFIISKIHDEYRIVSLNLGNIYNDDFAKLD